MAHKEYKVGETPIKNRILDDDAPLREITFMPSTMETIDHSVRDWVDYLDVFTTTNEGFKKVPILWVTPERAYQIKNNRELYDNEQTLIFPLITIERTAIIKDPSFKGAVWGNIPPYPDHKGGSITVARRLNQVKTSNFVNADAQRIIEGVGKQFDDNNPKKSKKIVYQTITMPIPVYVTVMYSITVRTEYQQQMNDILTPFITSPGGINFVKLERDGHKFEGFVQQDFVQENNVSALQQVETIYKSRVDLKVLGHLMGAGPNEKRPKMVIRENAVEIKLPRERVIYGDSLDHIDKRGFYKE